MLKRYCDLCGREIKANEDYAEVNTQIKFGSLGKIHMKGVRNIYLNELCEDCYREFYNMYTDLREKKGI